MSFLIWGIASRSSSNSFCIYSVHLAIIFPFSINIVPSLLLIQPPEEHVELVARHDSPLILPCINPPFPSPRLSISLQFAFNHSSFASAHFFLIDRKSVV